MREAACFNGGRAGGWQSLRQGLLPLSRHAMLRALPERLVRHPDPVRAQYERFPYPPGSALRLPVRGQGASLTWERGVALARTSPLGDLSHGLAPDHRGLRILVAGAGTLEALVVARAHPRVREVVAVDLSEGSIARLRARVRLSGLGDMLTLARLRGQRTAPLTAIAADLRSWTPEAPFDLVLATNVLQHTPEPAALFERLTSPTFLNRGGMLRLVTYAPMGRFWIRRTGAWLRLHGLTPETPRLVKAAHDLMMTLPHGHPLRSAFLANADRRTPAGLVDAFLHAEENPLAPARWAHLAADAGLAWLADDHHPLSRSTFLHELAPATTALHPADALTVLDDLLEVATCPVLWFRHAPEAVRWPLPEPASPTPPGAPVVPPDSVPPEATFHLPSAPFHALGASLRRAAQRLATVGVDVRAVLATLRETVGPRLDAADRELPGLTMSERDPDMLCAVAEPWDAAAWDSLAARTGAGPRLLHMGAQVPGPTLAAQAAWLQLRHGAVMPSVGPLRLA